MRSQSIYDTVARPVRKAMSIVGDLGSIRSRSAALLAGVLLATTTSAIADKTDLIRLSTGETLMVEILSVETDLITFNHPALGTMTVPRNAVAEIVRGVERSAAIDPATVSAVSDAPPPAPAPPAPAVPATPAEAPAEPAEEDPERWKFRLTFAGGGAAGNTERVNFLLRFRANRETEAIRTRFESSYFYASSDGDKSDNRFSTTLRHDWLLPESRWFLFARGNYDYDEFQSWLHRAQAFGGAGYRLIEPPKFALDGLVGLGVAKEWKSENDDPRLEGLFGLEGAYDVAQDHQIVFATTFYPDFTDIGEFRWTNSVGWSWRFNTKSPLALTAGLEHEYQSQIDPGGDRNDVRVFAGIDWDF